MADPIPAPQEVKPPAPIPENVVKVATAKAVEKPAAIPAEPETSAPAGSSRKTLEAIASGTPVAEATTPTVESLPDRETVTALLNEANLLLLDLKDLRLLPNAVATQATDTPLGNEVRLSALRNILSLDAKELEPLQEKIRALNLPEAKPEDSAILGILTRYNDQHADAPIPNEVIDAVRSGTQSASAAVARMLQSNPDLAQSTWKELTGIDGFTTLSPTPENILGLAGIPPTAENMAKAKELFGMAGKPMKEPGALKEQAFMGVMYGALFLMFVTQIATGEQGGGGGH